MNSARKIFFLFLLAGALQLAGCQTRQTPLTQSGRERAHFIAFKDFSKFAKTPGTNGEIILTSPEISAPINWDELVASWNVATNIFVKVEARAIYPDHATKYYVLDLWSTDIVRHPRESVRRQRDADGNVLTDTLMLGRHGGKLQLRLTLGSQDGGGEAQIGFLGLSFCDSLAQAIARPPNRAAWGKVLEVPERRQGDYEGGGGWCSPTSLSMDLAYWSGKLHRPELDHPVPEVAAAINDTALDGTGNWPFNTAYAATFPGMRAYVTRLDDISELEDWIAAGVPVILSVSSYIVSNRTSGRDNGHLITCVGFTETGDVVVNDPGVSVRQNMRARRIYPRERVINAWKKSKNAVYLIYPEDERIPKNVLGHWDNDK